MKNFGIFSWKPTDKFVLIIESIITDGGIKNDKTRAEIRRT